MLPHTRRTSRKVDWQLFGRINCPRTLNHHPHELCAQSSVSTIWYVREVLLHFGTVPQVSSLGKEVSAGDYSCRLLIKKSLCATSLTWSLSVLHTGESLPHFFILPVAGYWRPIAHAFHLVVVYRRLVASREI